MVIDFYQNQKSDCSINEQCKDIQPTPAGHLFSPALCCKRNFSLNLVIRYILTPERTIWHWPRQSHHWTELSLKRLCTLLHYTVHRRIDILGEDDQQIRSLLNISKRRNYLPWNHHLFSRYWTCHVFLFHDQTMFHALLLKFPRVIC